MRDPLTNEEFEPKRSNQRFASAQNRIKYHNDKANKFRKENAAVDVPLKRNKKILDEHMQGKDKATYSQDFLRGAKYDFQYYTGTCNTKEGTGYYIYNYVLIFKDQNVHVFRKY